MLSYLHGFHAGNHADVLKHTTLTALLARLVAKDKPLRYIETHAGAGGYDLRSAAARKNREYESGIGKLWAAAPATAPPAVARWLELVHRFNAAATLQRYPGSPWLARESLRRGDSLFLYELHPAECRALQHACGEDRRVRVLRENGLANAIGLVPPPAKRAITLIDPSYELRDEHRQVLESITKASARFATGVIAIWYPVIERRWVERYERALRAAKLGTVATYELCITRPQVAGGLAGSGMFIVNPPWQLDAELAAALPWLCERLALDDGASMRIEA